MHKLANFMQNLANLDPYADVQQAPFFFPLPADQPG
jgi:hypothetical protein